MDNREYEEVVSELRRRLGYIDEHYEIDESPTTRIMRKSLSLLEAQQARIEELEHLVRMIDIEDTNRFGGRTYG